MKINSVSNYTLVLIILFSFNIFSQKSAENRFNEAVNFFKTKKFQTALTKFQELSAEDNKYKTASKYFAIKSLNELEQFSDAESQAVEFISNFSSSKYIDEVYILLINSLLEQKKYKSAFERAIELIKNTNSVSYRIEGKNIAQNIAEIYLSSNDIKKIANQETDNKLKPFLLYVLGNTYLSEGDIKSAELSFNDILENNPRSDEYFLAKNSLSKTGTKSSGEILVGVILPLTDDSGAKNIIGNEMLEGIKYAFHEFNSNRENKIGLLIRDTKRDLNRIEDIVNEFEYDERIKIVIGPVYSDEAGVVIASISSSDLAIVSPTATDEDLTENNDYFFQANPPFSVRGKIFAQYIYFREGVKSLAILNSLEGYSPILARSFADEFQKLGGNILVRETYRSKSFNLSEQISKFVPYAEQLEAVYVPLSDKLDSEFILSELLKENLSVRLYGNQDWMNAKGLETSSTLSSTLKITSDFFIDYSDQEFREFSEKFVNITGKDITRNVLYGYDTAKYITTVLRTVQPIRKIIKLKMESGLKSTGFHNNISFSNNRRNTSINILNYSDGKFNLVEKYRGIE